MKLIWTDPSIEDLRSIRDYIARDSDYYPADPNPSITCG